MNDFEKNSFEWWLIEEFKRKRKDAWKEGDDINIIDYVNLGEIEITVNGKVREFILTDKAWRKYSKWLDLNEEENL